MSMNNRDRGAEKLQLTAIRKNDQFFDVFQKLLLNRRDITGQEKEFVLSCALLFFSYYEKDKRFKSYFKIGYYIILKYSLLFDDYQPLYDVSLQIGFYPVSDYLLRHGLVERTGISETIVNNSISKRYVSFEGYIETLEQNAAAKNILAGLDQDIVYIAPTSYGKSSIIREIIKRTDYSRIGIIVPTKSLLIQTYNDIKKLGLDYKLILHDEMYEPARDSRFIGILTQERATRLINKGNVSFDILFIDEAHNLLDDDSRSIILSRLIQLNGSLKRDQKLVYLSPLIDDSNNVKLRHIDNSILTKRIQHDLKTVELYLCENGECFCYDRFTGEYVPKGSSSFWDYVIQTSLQKNFIYHNRPKFIEQLAIALSEKLPEIKNSDNIDRIINTLKREVHPSFYMVSLLEHGVIYLHGKIPNLIKEYLEDAFKKEPELRYILANNVILEGVNHPIDNLFIASTYGLDGKRLTNLIGRVNRLNQVFRKNDNLKSLISTIHFVSDPAYNTGGDMKNKIKLLRDHDFDDEVRNPLLQNYDIENLKLTPEQKDRKTREDNRITEATALILSTAELDENGFVKKYLIENAIDNFYNDVEAAAYSIIQNKSKYQFDEEEGIVDIIQKIFVISSDGNMKDYEIERLKNTKAVAYYNHYLKVLQKQALNERINSTVSYFKEKRLSTDTQLFIGSSYGEERRASRKYNCSEYGAEVYINLKNKTEAELVNFAIVKLKIEEDFVNFKLNKLIVCLHDLGIIPDDYYNLHVYGTTDLSLINLVRYGLGVNIVRKLMDDNQIRHLSLDRNGNLTADPSFNGYLELQSDLFQFEINKYLLSR